MIGDSLSFLSNHLWQSTAFAGIVWLLTLALKKNRAAVRYRLWLAASIKFLIPFSLLIAAGRQVDWPAARMEAPPALILAVEGISEPFASTPAPGAFETLQPGPQAPIQILQAAGSRFTAILIGVWLVGVGIVLLLWFREWRLLRVALKSASAAELKLPHGGIRVLTAAMPTEPGIVGIFRPALLLPKGLMERLTPEQVEAVVAHELCHVRRRDNLAAAVHMVVEAAFWFHPLVWWIERRLVQERERACDEEVLIRGGEPKAYAEGILNVCKLYKESALACVSGVAGADLKKRIEDIMTNRVAHTLSFGRRALLILTGFAALAGPVAIGVAQATAGQVANTSYSFSPIDVPGSSLTAPAGIDAVGRVVGYYVDGAGTHGFLFDNGAYSSIDYPGARWTVAYAVNSSGQIVGAYGQDEAGGRHGFLLNRGSFSSFDVPGSTDTVARGLNNRGQIVGDYLGPDGQRHGFLLSGGEYSTIEVPESGAGIASAINDSGQIAGLAGTRGKEVGFLFSGGSYSPIQFPNSSFTAVLGLNNLGDLVGQVDGLQPPFRGFRRSGGGFFVIDVPDYPFSWDARAINDLGQIVGAYSGTDGRTRGYLATPTALRRGPADSRGVAPIPGVTRTADPSAPGNPATQPGSTGPLGPQGPPGPPGLAGSRGERASPGPAAIRSLNATRNALGRGLQAVQGIIARGQIVGLRGRPAGAERGWAGASTAEEALAAINLAMEDVAAAIDFINANPDAVEGAAATPPGPRDFTLKATRPGLQVGINQLHNALETLESVPGGDLGGLRPRIEQNIMRAIERIVAADGVDSRGRSPAAGLTPAASARD